MTRAFVCFALLGLVLATSAAKGAETVPGGTPRVIDVALQEGGILYGQVVNREGRPVGQTTVSVQTGEQLLGVVKTDEMGRFAIRGLNPGVYQMSASEGTGMYRLWSPRTAPPGAQQAMLIVAGEDVSRGQALSRLGQFVRNPWVIGGAVATAIAVPIAIAADDDEPASP